MSRGTVRWIAIAVIAAMISFFFVGLIGGRGDPAGPGAGEGDAGAEGLPAGGDGSTLDGPHVVLELCAGVACAPLDATAQQQLQGRVDADARVASTRFVSSEQAYELFLEIYGDDQELVEQVDPDTVPAEIQVDLHDIDDIDDVVAAFEDLEGVAAVHDVHASEVEP